MAAQFIFVPVGTKEEEVVMKYSLTIKKKLFVGFSSVFTVLMFVAGFSIYIYVQEHVGYA